MFTQREGWDVYRSSTEPGSTPLLPATSGKGHGTGQQRPHSSTDCFVTSGQPLSLSGPQHLDRKFPQTSCGSDPITIRQGRKEGLADCPLQLGLLGIEVVGAELFWNIQSGSQVFLQKIPEFFLPPRALCSNDTGKAAASISEGSSDPHHHHTGLTV